MRWNGRRHVAAIARRVCAATCAVLLFACSPDAHTIAPEDLMVYLEQGKAGRVFNLVDLRPREEYEQFHLPGAINVPYERLATDRLLFLDGLPVIFYDDTGPDLERLAEAAGARLPRNVVFLAGGFRGWRAAGLPVKTGA